MPQPTAQRPGIFICYRRDDSAGHAGRLYDRLSAHFGDEQIFMDLDRIEAGEDFALLIEEAVGSCEILLALVGRDWLASRDETGRRLDNPNDFVRLEITAALARDVSVIPVLLEGARVPRPQDLPEDLRPLTRRQAFELSDRRWRHDVGQLIDRLERVLARRRAQREEEERRREAEARRQAEEDERLGLAAVEEEQRKREAEEAERARREAEGRAPRTVETSPAARGVSASPTSPTKQSPPLRDDSKGRVVIAGYIVLLFGIGVAWAVWGEPPAVENTTSNANQVQNVNSGGVGNTGQKVDPPQATPSPPQPPERMVYVPGGEFQMGSDAGDEFEKPAHTETVKPFFIDLYEVTCGEYERFVQQGSRAARSRKAGACPQNQGFRAATGVTWYDADAFCSHHGKRLPTEAEWEFAARGTDGRRYPWGDEWRAQAANAEGASTRVMDIGGYEAGRSPFGVYDMVGNAWEWTASDLSPYPNGRLPSRPQGTVKVIRGGSFAENRTQATATYRGYLAANSPNNEKTGFRCVKDVLAAQGQ
jgi:formylglycine-generating enzyme required for sulfatase activity